MRHRKSGRQLNRNSSHRKAMFSNMATSLIEHGIIDPLPGAQKHYRFTATSLRRTRVTVSLQRDLGVNLPGAALALDLLERIDEMEAQLRQMQTPDPGR